MEIVVSNENTITGPYINGSTLDELEALIIVLQNDNYASPIARLLLTLLGEIVVWQYRNRSAYV